MSQENSEEVPDLILPPDFRLIHLLILINCCLRSWTKEKIFMKFNSLVAKSM